MKGFLEFQKFEKMILHEEDLSPGVVFTFGRFNTPTRAHAVVFDTANNIADTSGSKFYIFTSHTQDSDDNPLDYTKKIEYLRKLFPQYASKIVQDDKIRTAFDVCYALYSKGYRRATMVVGSDKVDDFNESLNHYNGKRSQTSSRFYDFDGGIRVVQAGQERAEDPNDMHIKSLAAKYAREAAKKGDFKKFAKISPKADKEIIMSMFKDVRKALGLSPTPNVELHKSEEREKFFNGHFKIGDWVLVEDKEVEVTKLGPNYLETRDPGTDEIKNFWIKNCTKL